ncbi:uncharacterized protein F4822DRAFT_428402 [Hypoxylon trugodes]|uniref:uncharacterized protein n=1 Tax=Hypoxylon trugodes TaxID=326681 RepID=UPI00218F01D9|nr:uncharacterized protein F4822DRAFT_428402 [Hypoxylon trugodes]KAI1390055.1 hypothetical protein F4822DRAFT_428402 [Hypoxylon trugodes]
MLTSLRPRHRAALILVSIFLFSLWLLRRGDNENAQPAAVNRPTTGEAAKAHPHKRRETEIVVASTTKEDASWVYRHFPQWNPQVYVTDDTSAPLTVPKNKGHEAMVYLTYIIENYDTLPDNIIFIHASRFQWHNDDPDYDILPTLRNFRLPYLREAGYVNLRCVWVIGCPAEIRPFDDEENEEQQKDEKKPVSAKGIYRQAFEELLPEIPVPKIVAVSCCSQFAVTRTTIQRHPKEKYIFFRKWLLETPLKDSLSGRVLEFSWHIIFGKDAYHCPSAKECYCNVFGLCDLQCTDSACDGRYILPPYSSLPDGWPKLGWNHEDRGYAGNLD